MTTLTQPIGLMTAALTMSFRDKIFLRQVLQIKWIESQLTARDNRT